LVCYAERFRLSTFILPKVFFYVGVTKLAQVMPQIWAQALLDAVWINEPALIRMVVIFVIWPDLG
jgi:hypothetical protein